MGIITIVGAGMMGSALCFPASDNGHEIRLVGTPLDREIINHAVKTGEHLTLQRKLPAGVQFYQIEQLEHVLSDADVLISGVSSFGVDWFSEFVIPKLPEGLPILSVTKGMINTDDGSLMTYPQYYALQHPEKNLPLYSIGGPCTSYELANHDQTQVCFCGEDMVTLRKLKALMTTSYYHISLSCDVTGVECAVAIKNAYALGVSLAIGLSQRKEGIDSIEHYNSQAALFYQSIREMRRLIKLAGGNDDNIAWAAGDLYVTVFGGRTRKIGILLGRGLTYKQAMAELSGMTLESVVITKRMASALRARIQSGTIDAQDFPLMLHIDDVIRNEREVDVPWEKFTYEAAES